MCYERGEPLGSGAAACSRCASEGWWALVDDLRTIPLGQIATGIPHIGELSLLDSNEEHREPVVECAQVPFAAVGKRVPVLTCPDTGLARS